MIVGSGAFAVENVRTCVEFEAKKVYMVCRRKTISMPRLVSWLINQSYDALSAKLTLEAMSPMYDLIGVDQWSYYGVQANESRTTVTIKQKSRFGIGDVYFLGVACGFCEHIVDDTKRVSGNTIHLVSGRRLDNVSHILKLLGFNGEFENDRLMKLKDLYGWWVNKDFRRYIVAEPIYVDANNFGSTSFSPGAIMWASQQAYILKYPSEWANVMESGMLPTHEAEEEMNRPAYVVEARHGALTGITLSLGWWFQTFFKYKSFFFTFKPYPGEMIHFDLTHICLIFFLNPKTRTRSALVRGLAEAGAVWGPLKRQKQLEIHPPEKILECAKREWDEWRKASIRWDMKTRQTLGDIFRNFSSTKTRWNFTCWYFSLKKCIVSVAIVGTSRVRR